MSPASLSPRVDIDRCPLLDSAGQGGAGPGKEGQPLWLKDDRIRLFFYV